MINFFQKAIARKIGNTFKIATEQGYDVIDFSHRWFCSEVAKRIFDENPADIAQWALYQIDSLVIELEEKGLKLKVSDKQFPAEMYWIGYTLTYWGFSEGINGKQLDSIDITWMINQYDVLHTTSTEYTIEAIKEYFSLEQNQKERE